MSQIPGEHVSPLLPSAPVEEPEDEVGVEPVVSLVGGVIVVEPPSEDVVSPSVPPATGSGVKHEQRPKNIPRAGKEMGEYLCIRRPQPG